MKSTSKLKKIGDTMETGLVITLRPETQAEKTALSYIFDENVLIGVKAITRKGSQRNNVIMLELQTFSRQFGGISR